MEALERMFEDSEDEVTTYEVDTEDEELEDLNEFDVELIEFIGDQLDEITDEDLDEAIDQLDEVKKIKRSKKPWEAKGMSKGEYKKFLKQKAKDWKKDKAGQKRAAKLAKKRKGKKPKFTFAHYDPSEDDSIVKLAQRVLQQHTEVEGDEELSEEEQTDLDTYLELFDEEQHDFKQILINIDILILYHLLSQVNQAEREPQIHALSKLWQLLQEKEVLLQQSRMCQQKQLKTQLSL